jgi:DNA gyrase subunit A
VASFPAYKTEQLMLVTDQAKMIRMSVGDTRIIGRNSAGVRLFHVADNESVVSAARIEESNDDDDAAADGTEAVADAESPVTDNGVTGDGEA